MSAYQVVNPATGESLRVYPEVTEAELSKAMERADEAHATWTLDTSIAERADLARRVADLHGERRQVLAEVLAQEMGKPIAQGALEIDLCTDIYRYYADNAETFLRDEPIPVNGGDGTALIRRSSIGALLGIMPWNFPYYQVARFAGPNLILGNTVLIKPAQQCPESAAALATLFRDAGYPAGAYATIRASNEQVARLIADPRIRGVSVTGSGRAGAAVAKLAGQHLKKVVLELGGSDPFLLLSAAQLDECVSAAAGARLDNCGQSCNAPKRFIVIDELYDRFVDRFAARMAEAEPGDPLSADTDLGPLSSTAAADRLQDQLDRAVARGGRIVVGGERTGNYFAPTVVVDVKRDSEVYHEEVFGPVAFVCRATSEDEAVDLANDTPFGLGSYVFSDDREQALRVADRLEAGMVFINGVLADAPELPFGGVKESGFGRELGPYGMEEFANKKLIRVVA